MHIELVESLRCPEPHDDTWLVAAVERFEGRYIADGSLGCPICRRHYAIRRGVTDFRRETAPSAAETLALPRTSRPSDSDVFRAAALLDLSEPGGVVLLGGEAAALSEALEDAMQVATLLLNPLAAVWRAGSSVLLADDVLPVAAGVLRAALLDATTATPGLLDGAGRALRGGGRLVAPAAAPLPSAVHELARDAHQWVAEATPATSVPVPLRRR